MADYLIHGPSGPQEEFSGKRSPLVVLPGLFQGEPTYRSFVNNLATDYDVAFLPLPTRGMATEEAMSQEIKNLSGLIGHQADKAPGYVTHGLGCAALAKAVNTFNLPVAGLYAIAPVLSTSVARGYASLASWLPDSLAAASLSLEHELRTLHHIPKRFALATKDKHIGTDDFAYRVRLRHFLNHYEHTSVVAFQGVNHMFNTGRRRYPFNGSDAEPLVRDVLGFFDELHK